MSRVAPLLALAAIAWPGCSSPCFVDADAAPGWKRVALPPGDPALSPAPAIALAAPEGVDQFRDGEPALVWEPDAPAPPPSRPRFGVIEYQLPSAGARAVELELAAGLDGARVDATGDTPMGRVPLVAGRRVRDRRVHIEWERDDVRSVALTIHKNLRPLPLAMHYRAGVVRTVELEGAPASERAALYYRQPPGAPVELCPASGRRLTVGRAALPPSAREVAPAVLARAPSDLWSAARRFTGR